MTITVIYGAGATYDSDPSKMPGDPRSLLAGRPPLAANLFDGTQASLSIVQRFPTTRAVIPRLRNVQGGRVEEVLGEIQDEARSDPVVARQLLGLRLYLREYIEKVSKAWYSQCGGVTNYGAFHGYLNLWRQRLETDICYVTFNYDRLLDWALQDVHSVELSEPDSYTSTIDGVSLFKLHGSVDWVQPLPELRFRYRDEDGPEDECVVQRMMNFASELVDLPSTDIKRSPSLMKGVGEMVSENGVVRRASLMPLLPAIAIPVRTKYAFVLPDQYIDQLRAKLATTTVLILIGWRGQEGHFLELMENHLSGVKNCLVVDASQSSASAVVSRLTDAGVDIGRAAPAHLQGFSSLGKSYLGSFMGNLSS